ncbi:MAG: hypothetical protein LQ338_001350 [Usnochroma carphineum]|nr:MAG: hypothetical protein LQ338_001350 [Usnochroma carphineum]
MEDFWSAPPVARTWTAATLATSVLVYGRMINGMRLIFSIPLIFKLPVPEALSGFVLRIFPTFLSPMILALAYTYSQDNRRKKVNFYIVQLEAKWLPWVMLLAALILGGPYYALHQGTGIIAAHLYDFLTRLYPTFGGGRNYLQTPAFIRGWFGGPKQRTQQKGYGTAYAPQAQQAPRPAGGFSTAFSSPWSSRGAGRRLGGD